MGIAATTQFNIRIDEAAKREGDKVFSSIGLTPTKAVRAFYNWAIRNKSHPEVLEDVLYEGKSEELDEECQRLLKIAEEGRQIIPNALAAMGITDPIPNACDDPYEQVLRDKELVRQAAWEKYCADRDD